MDKKEPMENISASTENMPIPPSDGERPPKPPMGPDGKPMAPPKDHDGKRPPKPPMGPDGKPMAPPDGKPMTPPDVNKKPDMFSNPAEI